MPVYEYRCSACEKVVALKMTMAEHDKGDPRCPECGKVALRPLIGSVSARTSRKS